MKRFFALQLVVIILINIFPISIFAVDTEALCADGHTYGECRIVQHNTRQFTCEICGDTSVFERIKIPCDYTEKVYIEKNPSGVYFGSRNVADLLGLKSGIYTNGEVTIVIDGTNISVSGTPTKNTYFDVQTGEFGVPNYLRDVGYNMPDGDYRFGLVGSGSVFPTACIRNADGNGNLISIVGVRLSKDLSSENFGVPYLYMPKGKTFDFSGNLILNISADRSYDGDIAKTTKIEGVGIYNVSGYFWSADEGATVFAELEDSDKPATNHNYVSVITPPTCTEQGYTTYTCDCGESYVGDYVEALNHNYASVITSPTCTEQGYTTYTCDCGETYVGNYVEALNHNYVDRGCTLCGARNTSTFCILDMRCDRVEVFTYEVGMTWTEWLNSQYNVGMGSSIAIWVGGGPNILDTNFCMDIFANGDPLNYDTVINEKDDLQLIRY